MPNNPPDYWIPEDTQKYEYSIDLSTNVIFLGAVYRQVYCLDISPSVSTVVNLSKRIADSGIGITKM